MGQTGGVTTTRSFVALGLPDHVREAVAALPRRFGSESGLAWARAAQAHLTLAFLGERDDEALARVRRRARELAASAAPFAADLRGAGAFPQPQRARVLWLGWGEGSAAVEALQVRLADGLREDGFALEARRFHPHVTLARARTPRDVSAIVSALATWRSDPWQVTALDVMASRLTPSGALHTQLERCLLGAAPGADVPR